MSSAEIYTTFGLEIVSALGTPPRRSLKSVSPFRYTRKEIPNEQMAELLQGRSFVSFSDPRADLVFGDIYYETAEYRVLRELSRRGVGVHIYPLAPATSQLFASLNGTLDGDGAESTYSAGWDSGADDSSRAFVIIPDDRDGGYAEEFDPDDPLYLSEIRLDAGTESTPPLERGLYLFRSYENIVPNALLGDVSSDMPDGWTASGLGVAGTGHGTLTGGCAWNTDLSALWAKGTPGGTAEFRSPMFDLPGVAEDNWMASVLLQAAGGSGRLYVEWFTAASVLVQRDEIDRGSGTVLISGVATRPGATSVKAQLCLEHRGGLTYWSMPQFCDVMEYVDRKYQPPLFIGASGDGNTAKLASASLSYAGPFMPGNETILAVAETVTVPMSTAELVDGVVRPLATLESTVEEIGIWIGIRASGGKTQLVVGYDESGTHSIEDSVDIVGHTAGDQYAFIMVVDGTDCYGYIRKIGGDTTYTVNWSTPYQHGDLLAIGSYGQFTTDEYVRSDCLHNSVIVASASSRANAKTMMELLADEAFLELLSVTSGRIYHINLDMSKDPLDTMYHSGSIMAYEQDRC